MSERSGPAPMRRYVEQIMGMPITLAVRGRYAADGQADAAWAQVTASLREADRVFSTYRTDSDISRLARAEITVADCPAEVAEVLALGERARLDSGGAFDVRRPGHHGAPVLDPSGVVKGWAVQRAAAHLVDLADTDFCLSAGGDMVCRVSDPDSPAWRVGVEDPRDPTRTVAVLPVYDGAVATSGTAHRGAHLIDPRTGLPPAGLLSVTVACADLVAADIDATSAFVMGLAGLDWLASRGRRAVVVTPDGSVHTI